MQLVTYCSLVVPDVVRAYYTVAYANLRARFERARRMDYLGTLGRSFRWRKCFSPTLIKAMNMRLRSSLVEAFENAASSSISILSSNSSLQSVPRAEHVHPGGLFGFSELKSKDGFLLLTESALQEAQTLQQQVIDHLGCPKAIELCDQLSDTVCKVADAVSPCNSFAFLFLIN